MSFLKNTVIIFLFLCMATIAFANDDTTAEFFASNNTGEINIKTAYDRLTGHEQNKLQHEMIRIFQKNHIEQGRFENILGGYRMNDQNMTADNTEKFGTSPYQPLSDETVFSIAQQLAIILNQESVAVFLPDKSSIGGVVLKFTRKPGINEVITLLHNKLPPLYSQAFSMHPVNTHDGFNKTNIGYIEWLGSQINPEEIKKAFPGDKINYYYGKVFLVYQNGQRKQI